MASSPRSAERAGPVVLVGMMGSGKSTVGRALAEALGRPFVDLDSRVEEATGRTVAEVFAADGEAAFRRWESKVLREVLVVGGVVAAGGGIVTRPENVGALREADATVVWLRARVETLLARLGAGAGEERPLLAGDVEGSVRRLAEERAPLYESAAGVVVDVDGLSPDEVVARVVEAVAA